MSDFERGGRVTVLRDGAPVQVCENENEAFAWLQRHQGQSVSWAMEHEGYAFEPVEPWDDADARHHAAMARNVLYGDEFHNQRGCVREGRLGRENCGPCCLLGYEPRGGFGDGYSVKQHGPNYGGWLRIYVEARRPVPAEWRHLVAEEISQKGATHPNAHYARALARSIATFGIRFSR